MWVRWPSSSAKILQHKTVIIHATAGNGCRDELDTPWRHADLRVGGTGTHCIKQRPLYTCIPTPKIVHVYFGGSRAEVPGMLGHMKWWKFMKRWVFMKCVPSALLAVQKMIKRVMKLMFCWLRLMKLHEISGQEPRFKPDLCIHLKWNRLWYLFWSSWPLYLPTRATLITELESQNRIAVLIPQTQQVANLTFIAEHDPTICFGVQTKYEFSYSTFLMKPLQPHAFRLCAIDASNSWYCILF